MNIDFEKFLSTHKVLPLESAQWKNAKIDHWSDVNRVENSLIEELRNRIPKNTGGIYVYKNRAKKCIYIGKSANLRDRFRTHFRRAHQKDKSDKYGKHHEFWKRNAGSLLLSWIEIEREVDRQIIEIMLTELLDPEFCKVPRMRKLVGRQS